MTKITINTKAIEAQLKKQQREAEKQSRAVEMQNRASAIVANQPQMSNFRRMDHGSEDAFRIIIEKYQIENKLELCLNADEFPKHLQGSIAETLEKLKLYGVLASYRHYVTSIHVTLMPQAASYFLEKEQFERKDLTMFNRLPNNSKQLLDALLLADNPTRYLCERFEKCETEREDEDLRSLTRELTSEGFINIPGWADNCPMFVEINNLARTYNEREAEYERQMRLHSPTVFNIGTINADGSNLVFGDANSSTLYVNNAINQIKSEIENKGGEDKQELLQLLDEAIEIIDNIKATRAIPKNKGFFSRVSAHFEKHGWFYAEIVGLIGTAAMLLIQG